MNTTLSRRLFLGLTVSSLACTGTPALLAQAATPSTNYSLTVRTDHADALYKQGESVQFTVRLLLDQQPVPAAEVQWTLSKDGVPPVTTGKLRLTNGLGAIAGTLDEPGFLQCKVTFRSPARTTVTGVGGAGMDPLQIKPSLPVPADFDAFWTSQKRKLAELPVNAKLTSVKSPQTEVECFDLQADSVGAPVSGYFAKPAGARPKSLPR